MDWHDTDRLDRVQRHGIKLSWCTQDPSGYWSAKCVTAITRTNLFVTAGSLQNTIDCLDPPLLGETPYDPRDTERLAWFAEYGLTLEGPRDLSSGPIQPGYAWRLEFSLPRRSDLGVRGAALVETHPIRKQRGDGRIEYGMTARDALDAGMSMGFAVLASLFAELAPPEPDPDTRGTWRTRPSLF